MYFSSNFVHWSPHHCRLVYVLYTIKFPNDCSLQKHRELTNSSSFFGNQQWLRQYLFSTTYSLRTLKWRDIPSLFPWFSHCVQREQLEFLLQVWWLLKTRGDFGNIVLPWTCLKHEDIWKSGERSGSCDGTDTWSEVSFTCVGCNKIRHHSLKGKGFIGNV